MRKKLVCLLLTAALAVLFSACGQTSDTNKFDIPVSVPEEARPDETIPSKEDKTDSVTNGTERYRDFVIDNLLRSEQCGDIRYNVYIPENYDGSRPYALYFTLPGYEGLYFQGAAQNLKSEAFGFEAQKYNGEMIIVAPQLGDWGETSADQTIALVEYFLENYNINRTKVYVSGYSGGGETMSLVLGKRPELFTAYLHVSSRWNGTYEPIVKARLPVYFAIVENDEYYGSEPTQDAYNALYSLYKQEGLTEAEIDELLCWTSKTTNILHSETCRMSMEAVGCSHMM